jgi:hypothetical protein
VCTSFNQIRCLWVYAPHRDKSCQSVRFRAPLHGALDPRGSSFYTTFRISLTRSEAVVGDTCQAQFSPGKLDFLMALQPDSDTGVLERRGFLGEAMLRRTVLAEET